MGLKSAFSFFKKTGSETAGNGTLSFCLVIKEPFGDNPAKLQLFRNAN